jgi:CHAT domain-containing protein
MMNLATAYSDRIRGDRAENLEQALGAYRQALEILTPDALPDDCRRAARGLANLCFTESCYAEVVDAYELARQANNNLLQAAWMRGSKEAELSEVQGLASRAAYALARLGRLEEAVEVLEAGQARLLAEALEANRRDLERLATLGHADLLARYRAAAGRIAALQAQAAGPAARPGQESAAPRDYAALSEEIATARAELDAAIAAIRQVPGYADFFLPSAFADIQAAAHSTGPLVYLAATPAGSLALIVPAAPESSSAVWLDGLTEARLRETIYGPADDPRLGGYLGAYAAWRANSRNTAARAAWHAALDVTTGWLWHELMAPVVTELRAQGVTRAVLIPAGLLGLLPLHAAWTEDSTTSTGRRYALDELTLAYAPNASALAVAHDTAASVPPSALLAVDNPDGSLVFSAQEVDAALSYFPAERRFPLHGAAATREAVLDQLPGSPVCHFSTHGWAGWSEPLAGGLLMAGDEALTLADLLDLRLPATRLAVLSACETGIPGTNLPDEVIGLPAGLLQAGAAGVVGSLWSVNDLSTAMLMERFYRLWREDGLEPALALREAQRWLRDTTNWEKAEYFQADAQLARMPASVAREFFANRAARDRDQLNFSHPFWWAAFSFTGV